MRVTLKVCALLTALCVLLPTLAAGQKKAGAQSGELAELNAKIRRFAPTVVTADTSRLSAGDRRALAKIVEAARLFDPLFLRQVWSGNVALQATARSRQDAARARAPALLHASTTARGRSSTRTSPSCPACRTRSPRRPRTTPTT